MFLGVSQLDHSIRDQISGTHSSSLDKEFKTGNGHTCTRTCMTVHSREEIATPSSRHIPAHGYELVSVIMNSLSPLLTNLIR